MNYTNRNLPSYLKNVQSKEKDSIVRDKMLNSKDNPIYLHTTKHIDIYNE